MAKLAIKPGSTSISLYVFIQDSSSITGAGLTGLTYWTSGISCYYVRSRGSATQIQLAGGITPTSAWLDRGFTAIDETNMPGIYRLDIPNAVCAVGARNAVIMLKGATNMAPVVLEIDLSNDANVEYWKGAAAPANTGDAYAVVNNATYGNAQLVRSTTPANKISVDTAGNVYADVKKVLADTKVPLGLDYMIEPGFNTWNLSAWALQKVLEVIGMASADMDAQLSSLPRTVGEYLLEGSYSRDDVLRIIAAVLAGKTSGSGTHSIGITGIDGETTRVAAELDGAGNRTSMALNAELAPPSPM